MVSLLFGFGGRVGRLEYFLLSCALSVFAGLLSAMVLSGLAPAHVVAGDAASTEAMVRPVLIAVVVIMPIVTWFSLALQAKRFRHGATSIGSDPLCSWPLGTTRDDCGECSIES